MFLNQSSISLEEIRSGLTVTESLEFLISQITQNAQLSGHNEEIIDIKPLLQKHVVFWPHSLCLDKRVKVYSNGRAGERQVGHVGEGSFEA